MLTSESQKPILEQETAIGRFVFYPNIVVGEIKEGVHATYENAKETFQLGAEIYGKENEFIYISHRINSYSVDPIWLFKAKKQFPNCKGFVLVADRKGKEKFSRIERLFLKINLVLQDNLENAITWADQYFTKKGR